MNKFSAIDISASGMAAERLRMEVAANNIANANASASPDGQPYQRRVVAFASAMDQAANLTAHGLSGVEIIGVRQDESPFPLIYDPSHPDADQDGMVKMPNVQMPNEMIDMMTASRSYEANLRAISIFKEMVEQSLQLLSGGR